MKTNFLPLLQMDLYGAMGDDGASLPTKTAMQELIEKLDDKFMNPHLDRQTLVVIANFKREALKLLEKEKEQIMKAYCDGFDELLPFHENEYYNQTYNQNK